MKPLAHSLSLLELEETFRELGQPTFRAAQLWRWLYVQRSSDVAEMLNLPLALRDKLAETLAFNTYATDDVEGSPSETRKILVSLRDGEQVEAVLIPGRNKAADGTEGTERRTVCVSTQVGCRFGCAFCASGQNGLIRNLEAGEIVGQVLAACELFGERVSNVVYMGIGEPFDNTDAVLRSIAILNDADGLNIGARRITVSTCGVIPGIQALAEEGRQIELSVSLHSPFDDVRGTLMPVNVSFPIARLLDSCRDYSRKTGRIVTFEYTLIRGVNDRPEDVEALVGLLRRLPCRVNLIPLSPVEEFDGTPTPSEVAREIQDSLMGAGINTTLRVSKGSRVKAACGQLRFRRRADAEDETTTLLP